MVVFSKFSHAGNVLANDVEFQIDCTANLDCVEISVVVSVWYYAYLKGIFRWVAYGQANTVDGDGALVNTEVSALYHLWCGMVAEGVTVAAFLVFNGYALGCLVNMSLYDMAIQSTIH